MFQFQYGKNVKLKNKCTGNHCQHNYGTSHLLSGPQWQRGLKCVLIRSQHLLPPRCKFHSGSSQCVKVCRASVSKDSVNPLDKNSKHGLKFHLQTNKNCDIISIARQQHIFNIGCGYL